MPFEPAAEPEPVSSATAPRCDVGASRRPGMEPADLSPDAAPLNKLLMDVRQLDYLRILGLTGQPSPEAVRGAVGTLRAKVRSVAGHGPRAGAAAGEILAALNDAEQVLCDPARGPLYALHQQAPQA